MVLYRIIIAIYFAAIRLVASFRRDAARWVQGRNDWRRISAQLNPNRKASIWIHVSSLGEFEQGRPLIDRIRGEFPDRFIWLSFFSPSGYEIRKNYKEANAVSYFPSDRHEDVCDFLDIVNPSLAIFVKYDFWFETLDQLQKRNIPFVFVSMHLHAWSYLRKFWARPLVRILQSGRHFFTQNEETGVLLKKLSIANVTVCGDTRLDRVLDIASVSYQDPAWDDFCHGGRILVAGSVWAADLNLLHEVMSSPQAEGWKFVLAPHMTDSQHIEELKEKLAEECIQHSKYQLDSKARVMIIDSVGKLAAMYSKGELCYVGGGFGKAIHNILEPAAHFKPVCFGPAHEKFPEATEFIRAGFGFEVLSARDLLALMKRTEDRAWIESVRSSASEYMNAKRGATEIILQKLKDLDLI